jgi:hypothetical protein
VVSAKGAGGIPKNRIGPKAKAFAAFLRYAIKISERDVTIFFRRIFNLTIVPSSPVCVMDQLKREALPLYNNLLTSLKKGLYIHADETGWPLDGKNHWLRKFSNKKVCVSHIDASRGQGGVENVIGKEYGGILIPDFLSAYNKIPARAKQRCLVHILRDMKNVMEYRQDDSEVMRYCERLKKGWKQPSWRGSSLPTEKRLIMKTYGGYVYLMTNKYNTLIYTGVTDDLQKRVYEHREGITEGFTRNTMLQNWSITRRPMISKAPSPEKNRSRPAPEGKKLP